MRDPERPPLKHRETHESTYTRPYTNYAHWIGREPTFAIFRRFASLNALNLLALQAEISHEEHELHTLQLDDVEFDNHTNFMRLIEADKDSNAGKQWQQILKLRPMLKQYNALLFENKKLFKLSKPNAADRKELMKVLYLHENASQPSWLEHPENIFEQIDGESMHSDHVTIGHRPVSQDRFTRWMFDRALPWMHGRFGGSSVDAAFREYDDETMDRVIGALVITGASLLPTVSIFALNYIPKTVYRLAFISVFSFMFTVALAFFTNARKIEIFTAAVALASVQVVFIGTQNC